MINILYLIVYFFSYAAGFAVLMVAFFALYKSPPWWMKTYFIFLLSSVLYLMTRNFGFFANVFLYVFDIEKTIGFYVIYMITCSFLVYSYVCTALELVSEEENNTGKIVGVIFANIPLLLIGVLLFRGTPFDSDVFRLDLMNAMMFYTYGVVVGWLLFLLFNKKKVKNIFRRDIINAILINGGLYAVFATVHWLTYFDEYYSLYPFSVINVAMTLVFTSSAILIGKEFFSHRAADRSNLAAQMASLELSDTELRIIAMIREGATNKDIAKELGLKLATIKNIIFKIYTNLKVKSRTELVRSLRGEPKTDGNSGMDDEDEGIHDVFNS